MVDRTVTTRLTQIARLVGTNDGIMRPISAKLWTVHVVFTCSASFSWANNISCGYVLQLVSKPMITDLDQRNRWEEEERVAG